MADTTCSHCAEPWDVYGLRHEGWGYLGSPEEAAAGGVPGEIVAELRVADDHTADEAACTAAGRRVNEWLYRAVLSGWGCPECGFTHTGEGEHRETQLEELVIGGVTDDDPMEFM